MTTSRPPASMTVSFLATTEGYTDAMKLLIAIVAALPLFAADETKVTLSAASFEGLPRVTATVTAHGSKEAATYEGVALTSLLVKAGVAAGEDIKGKKLSLVVVAKAADGYQAVYALAELDPKFSKKLFLLADRKNGKPIDEKEGPYRIVVPDEERQARWVRQVTSIVVRSVE